MKAEVIPVPVLTDNYAYLVLAEEGGCLVVDPGDAGPVRERLAAAGRTGVDGILVTHGHRDHVGGLPALREAFACWTAGPADAGLTGLDRELSDGDAIAWNGPAMEAISTPGHGLAHMAYRLQSEGRPGALFSGDALFVGGCGRLFGCDAAVLWRSLQRLASLPGDTQVYCGHEYAEENFAFALSERPDDPAVRARAEEVRALRRSGQPTVPSTVAIERDTNLFLRAGSAEGFAGLRRRKDRFRGEAGPGWKRKL